uniref:Uncharacterized protein n=1 Tax=Romanomermis culicivorax TaxID=13658 RepID=A0A915J2W9_ROMCU
MIRFFRLGDKIGAQGLDTFDLRLFEIDFRFFYIIQAFQYRLIKQEQLPKLCIGHLIETFGVQTPPQFALQYSLRCQLSSQSFNLLFVFDTLQSSH